MKIERGIIQFNPDDSFYVRTVGHSYSKVNFIPEGTLSHGQNVLGVVIDKYYNICNSFLYKNKTVFGYLLENLPEGYLIQEIKFENKNLTFDFYLKDYPAEEQLLIRKDDVNGWHSILHEQ